MSTECFATLNRGRGGAGYRQKRCFLKLQKDADRRRLFCSNVSTLLSMIVAQWYQKLKSPGQTITTFQRNIVGSVFASPAKRSQQFNTTLLGTTCGVHLATLSQHVRCCKSNYCACPGTALLHEPSQMTAGATSCNIHKCCIKNLTIFKLEPTTL